MTFLKGIILGGSAIVLLTVNLTVTPSLAQSWVDNNLSVKRADAQTFHNDRMYIWDEAYACMHPDPTKPNPNCLVAVPDQYVIHRDQTHKKLKLIAGVLVSGIETNDFKPTPPVYVPNWFATAAGWARQHFPLDKTTPLAPSWIGLAVNSANTRSEDQLHIHICYLSTDSRDIILKHKNDIKKDMWNGKFFLSFGKYAFDAMSISDIMKTNPFELLFDPSKSGAPRNNKAAMNLLVAFPLDQPKGGEYYILYSDRGAAEALLDLPCRYMP